MKPNILSTVSAVASLSSGAKQLAERVLAASVTAEQRATAASAVGAEDNASNQAILAADLRNKLAALDQRVRDLVEMVEDASDVQMTDTQVAEFRTAVEERLRGTQIGQLAATYDVDYFRSQPRTVRPIIASILANIFDSKNIQPLDLWLKISLSDGAM